MREIKYSSIRIFFIVWLLLIPIHAFSGETLQVLPLESIQLLRISPSDERAVIKTADGKLQIIKVGDALGNRGGRVIEIAAGRVVIEEKVDKEVEKVIIRLEGNKQRVERMKKEGEPPPPLLAPQTKLLDQDRNDGASGGSFTRKPSGR